MLYSELKSLFESCRDKSKGKPIGNNTYVVKTDRGFGIMYHATVIFDVNKRNRAVLNNGGWESVTTKARLNEYLPSGYYISQSKHVWYLLIDGKKEKYQNGFAVNLVPKKMMEPMEPMEPMVPLGIKAA